MTIVTDIARNGSFSVEGVRINSDSLSRTAQKIVAEARSGPSFGVFTLNLDHVVKLRRDARFREAYAKARFVTPDGFPIVWAGRLMGQSASRVAGADLVEPVCARAAAAGLPVFLFGSSFESLSASARRLVKQFPGLEIAGAYAPAVGFDPESDAAAACIKMIDESGAKICFVALGAPKQEIFSARALDGTRGIAFLCIGAGLDFIAGVQKRAPRWAQFSGMEWLWRLLSNPRRLGRRYLDCLLVLPSVLIHSVVIARPR